MIWCLSNARSEDLQFGTPFIALRALVREIIPNIIPTYPVTHKSTSYMTEIGFSSIVWLRLRAFGAQPPSELHRSRGRYGFYQGCGAVTFLVGFGSGSGSGSEYNCSTAPAPAPGKMYRLRLRLRWSSPHMSLNQQYDFQKCQMSKYDFLLTWPWVWMPLWTSAFEICHSLSSKVTGWHWRGHRLLRVALSEISDLGPKWSSATDTQRILNIRRRISPK